MEELAPPETVGHFSDLSAVSAKLKQVRRRPIPPGGERADTAIQRS
jgi:hypothetical protein